MLLEILIVFVLILFNGALALSELAVVSSRRARLQAMADDGSEGARAALDLADDPGRFLSAVQIGITLVGIVAGAFGGATLAVHLQEPLAAVPAVEPFAEELAFTLVVALITYFSLILGELVPKQLALRNPERVAALVARPMKGLSFVASPLVHVLDSSSALVLRLFGKAEPEQGVTEEEVRSLITQGTLSGVFEHAEKEMIERVLRLGDRSVRAIMTPRVDVVWLESSATAEEVLRTLREHGFSRYPVGRGGIDEVIGVVQTKELLDRALSGQPFDVLGSMVSAPVLPDGVDALRALEVLKSSPVHMALVVDEYGSFEGLVTAGDLLEAVVGEMVEGGDRDAAEIVRRPDGSWLVDGSLAADEMKDLLKLKDLPDGDDYHTVAGFLLNRLRHVPETGEAFDWSGVRFEVVDMDGRRIDKVLITRLPADQDES